MLADFLQAQRQRRDGLAGELTRARMQMVNLEVREAALRETLAQLGRAIDPSPVVIALPQRQITAGPRAGLHHRDPLVWPAGVSATLSPGAAIVALLRPGTASAPASGETVAT